MVNRRGPAREQSPGHTGHGGRSKLTPSEVARLWGVSRDTVLTWIHAGELHAVNAARHPHGRPRFRIDVGDLSKFAEARAVQQHQPQRRSHHRPANGVIEFF